jgi:histidinol phosphatase-like enzyme
MLEEAAVKLRLDLPNSWLVGDKPSDIEAALNAGLRRAVHVLTGYGGQTRDQILRLVCENRACKIHLCDAVPDVVPLLRMHGD